MPPTNLPSEEALREFYIGKDLNDAPKPCAVLDAAIIKRHCAQMLRAMKALNVAFRAHVKTHKVDPWHCPRIRT
jgi:D-serine deaminase-like pyridoxal phosphate-dependent protein